MNGPAQPSLFDQPPPPRRRQERKKNIANSEAAAEARQIAYQKIQRGRNARYGWILAALAERPMTANEIKRRLIELGYLPQNAERNAVSPRICELASAGCVEALDELRTVEGDAPASAWAITPRGRLLLGDLREKTGREKAN